MSDLVLALEAFLPDTERREELLDAATRSLLDAAIRKERELRADPDDVEHFFDRIAEFLRGGLPNYAPNGAEIAVSKRIPMGGGLGGGRRRLQALAHASILR